MILSIESSCDDSSLALTSIQECKLVFHQKISQDSYHSRYGGVVPEIASRLHAQQLPQILQELKNFLDGNLEAIKAIAITTEPGLSVSLIEGLMMAKALALALNLPLLSINHLKGHIYSLFINQKTIISPLSILLVSGGHTMILEMSHSQIQIIAKSLDDSFGESFDKASKMLGLGYPGGPIIQELAHDAPSLYTLPIPLQHSKELAFSFSGLKNAFRLKTQEKDYHPNALAKAFQESAIAHIYQRCKLYFQHKQSQNQSIQHFAIVGGASANLALRDKMHQLCQDYQATLLLSPLEFCSDNAAMIGRAGVESYLKGEFASLYELDISPRTTQF
ncbi:tRNA N6-adenosine(37)-threonylcarbamoyltransferase complex transferase subunit TsaD [Helicobacter enhydrae]|uniref:tRNA N6-adenosine threonylcarbamoyltransferase n=1 Tax=Helicobacter enhydrae TaxID=222136 RepID=A0A1B1U4I1_9HELI|nr:tRNA (adenosine(37)-N6)-threonylcarbamoyltransferase complex transferase subunit TsaD [Helicobacter enhydrae]ANV97673.1 tRNA N6-adenosine(37)-threonylcarbamoyltransferase complex transferase subunit TsaD [Helicobacter enhydrae]